jgi:hypothetical protein
LLATEGIGVFAQRHFIIQAITQAHRVGGNNGTHIIAWEALKKWADLKRSGEVLGTSILINGLALEEWVGQFMSGPSLGPVGKRWFKIWGMDLERFSEDRDARNESSYRPTRLSGRLSVTVSSSSEYISQMWGLCEPSVLSSFEKLDRYLLRLVLEDIFFGITGKKPFDDLINFKSAVESMVSVVVTSDASAFDWGKFLTRRIDPADPLLIVDAQSTDSLEHPRHDLQVISRAFLLLRVATGAAGTLLREAGITKEKLGFWWRAFGTDRGIWEPDNEPSEFSDMWDDVNQARLSVESWRKSVATNEQSAPRWQRDQAYPISVLGGCERIALWGLGL